MPGTLEPPRQDTLSARIDRAIAPALAALRSSRDGAQIEKGAMQRDEYIALLQSLLMLHRFVEHSIAAAAHLKGFDVAAFKREESILRDLKMLRGRLPLRTSPAIDRFESVARGWTKSPCVALVGALFVFERERSHSLRIVRQLAASLHVRVATRSGLDYHLGQSDRAARRLHGLRAWIDAHVRRPERERELIEGATKTLETLVALHAGAAPV